ncbi:hypothetical protein [Bdellovibrio sp. HCB337]|uniref:hypothetical protein n=1 Tax=Bdellovibrio sp. HCB337 TaxID=3394358 RepID=UPI0039A547D2
MKKFLLILMAAMTLSAAFAEAYITPGPRPYPGPGHPGRGPGRGPHRPYPPAPGYPPGPQTFAVPAYVDGNYYGSSYIDLGRSINLYQYRGYRLVAIDFMASAHYGSALMDILVNGFQITPTINLNSYPNNFRIFPNQYMVIGQGADSIVFATRGDMQLRNVFLQLSR